MAGTYLNLPAPVIDIIGWEDTAAISGGVTLQLPTPVMGITDEGVRGIALTLPILTLGATGVTGQSAAAAMNLPMFSMAAAGVTGQSATVALSLPKYQLSISDGSAVRLTMPEPVLAVEAVTGNIGSVTLVRPMPALVVTGSVQYAGGVALSLLPQMSVAGATGVTAGVALSLRSLALAIQGHSGAVGNASMLLPVMRLDVAGHGQFVGSVVLSLPMLALQATSTLAAGANFSTIALHTESNALTSYDNYKFNSFAQFNGVYLGANDNGIFALSGATDDGALINAAARVGLTDFGTSHLKRIDRCYVGYRADGSMILRVFTDEVTVRDYLLTATGKSGLHGNHVRIGKGLAARYWQFEIQNKDGADFTLDVMELKPTPLRRRIGGGDA